MNRWEVTSVKTGYVALNRMAFVALSLAFVSTTVYAAPGQTRVSGPRMEAQVKRQAFYERLMREPELLRYTLERAGNSGVRMEAYRELQELRKTTSNDELYKRYLERPEARRELERALEQGNLFRVDENTGRVTGNLFQPRSGERTNPALERLQKFEQGAKAPLLDSTSMATLARGLEAVGETPAGRAVRENLVSQVALATTGEIPPAEFSRYMKSVAPVAEYVRTSPEVREIMEMVGNQSLARGQRENRAERLNDMKFDMEQLHKMVAEEGPNSQAVNGYGRAAKFYNNAFRAKLEQVAKANGVEVAQGESTAAVRAKLAAKLGGENQVDKAISSNDPKQVMEALKELNAKDFKGKSDEEIIAEVNKVLEKYKGISAEKAGEIALARVLLELRKQGVLDKEAILTLFRGPEEAKRLLEGKEKTGEKNTKPRCLSKNLTGAFGMLAAMMGIATTASYAQAATPPSDLALEEDEKSLYVQAIEDIKREQQVASAGDEKAYEAAGAATHGDESQRRQFFQVEGF